MTDTNDTPWRPAGNDGSLTRQLGLDPADTHVFEFASPGPDEPPRPRMVSLPTWPGYVAHTRWPGDGPIYMFEGDAYLPDEPVDLRCSGCTAESTIAIDNLERRIVFIVGHQRGCRAIEDLIEMAGAP